MIDDGVVVLVPAGEPILVAAAWVGTACWAELRLHQRISDLLGTGTVAPLPLTIESSGGKVAEGMAEIIGTSDGQPHPASGSSVDREVGGRPSASSLWTVRAHRAEVAESWHRRLPELREFPRPDFVVPGPDGERLVAGGDVAIVLQALLDHYRQRLTQPMGPADGPVADTLAAVVARTEADLASVLS